IRPSESFSLQQVEKDFAIASAQVRVGPAFWRRVAEVTPAFDDLFRRSAADPELEPAIADQVGGAGVLDHIEGILVPHVDEGRSDLDAARPGADGGEKREGRRELLREMMDAKVRAVRSELLPPQPARSTAAEPRARTAWPIGATGSNDRRIESRSSSLSE